MAVVNFGDDDDPRRQFAGLAAFRQNVPRMTGEYWVGWFDHWGEVHHRTPAEHAAKGLEWMLAQGISFNLYMVHGGTSFGYMSGANLGKVYEPIVSAYDYDSPLDEAGRPTAKFQAIRAVIGKHLGSELPALPQPLPVMTVPRFELRETAPLASRLPRPFHSARPTTMEALGQSYGYVLYRRNVERAGKGTLVVEGVKDFAVVMQGARRLGALDRRRGESRLEVELHAGEPLDILDSALPRGVTLEFAPQTESVASEVELRRYILRNPAGELAPFYLLPGLQIDISASQIRDQIHNQTQPSTAAQTLQPALLPPPVLEYIRAHNLYR